MKLDPKIFREYDIRGVYGTDIDEEGFYLLGRAFGTVIIRKKGKKIVVARDNRASSLSLQESFIKGLVDSGILVTNIGISLTPVIHFLTCLQDFQAGVNITASHNPKEYNGLRLDYSDGMPFFGKDIKALEVMIKNKDFEDGYGAVIEEDLSYLYKEFFKRNFHFNRRLKVVVDCGSGASSVLGPDIFETLGIDCIPLNCKFDPEFPRGVPDPENIAFMSELSEEVIKHKADLGVAFDTDGDRVGIVDEKGQRYTTDKLLLLLARTMVQKYKTGLVVFDVKCSGVVPIILKKMGATVKRVKTGHSTLVSELKNGAILGAEYSGHVYFGGDYFGYDDGIYAACRVVKELEESGLPLSNMMNALPKTYTTEEVKVMCPDEKKFQVIENLKSKLQKIKKEFSEIDGVQVFESEIDWFLVRASNTSPYLSVRIESDNTENGENLRTSLVNLLSDQGLDLNGLKTAEFTYS